MMCLKQLLAFLAVITCITKNFSLSSQETKVEIMLPSGQCAVVLPDRTANLNQQKSLLTKIFKNYSSQSPLSSAEVKLINKLIIELAELDFELFKDSLAFEKDKDDLLSLKDKKLIDQSTYERELEKLIKAKESNFNDRSRLAYFFRKIEIIEKLNLKSRESFYKEIHDFGADKGRTFPKIPNDVWISRDIIVDDRTANSRGKICALTSIKNTKSKTIGYRNDYEFLFGYTHPNLRTYLKLKDFMEVYASVRKEFGEWFLDLDFRFESRDVKRSYGKLKKDDFIRFLFLNGKKLYIKHGKDVSGELQEGTGKMIYSVSYKLGSDQVKMFEESEIDAVGIMWESGFEDYKIYRITTILDQINCIRNAK